MKIGLQKRARSNVYWVRFSWPVTCDGKIVSKGFLEPLNSPDNTNAARNVWSKVSNKVLEAFKQTFFNN
jgi:hypothetical protein